MQPEPWSLEAWVKGEIPISCKLRPSRLGLSTCWAAVTFYRHRCVSWPPIAACLLSYCRFSVCFQAQSIVVSLWYVDIATKATAADLRQCLRNIVSRTYDPISNAFGGAYVAPAAGRDSLKCTRGGHLLAKLGDAVESSRALESSKRAVDLAFWPAA